MATSVTDKPASQQGDAELRAKQMQQAEELLFSGPSRSGFAKALFRGEFRGEGIFPYPELPEKASAPSVDEAVEAVRAFADEHIDAAAIDRECDIPRSVIDGLARLGVLGMAAPREWGGRGFSQMGYCRIMEVIGGHCASTAVFVNAHHSIGLRALVLFGTREQQERWLPSLASGQKLAAFALTEEQAGSDASNVQTSARLAEDGRTYILNGSKRYITNGAIADVLTVMARTPDPRGGESKVTAFLVTPDMPGFEVVEARMPKCGIRGTATARLAFHDMPVPATNILGPLGKGLKVALTVLDFGRTTFGASCTGAAKVYLAAATRHAANRQTVRPAARRARADQEEAGLPRRDRLCDGGDHLRDRRPDRQRRRRLHARNRHSQGLLDRGPLARVVRDAPGVRRPGLFQQRALRADDARCAHQHDRRRGQRGLEGVHRAGRHARHRRRTQRDARWPQEGEHVPADALELRPRATRAAGPHAGRSRGHADAAADRRIARPARLHVSAGLSSA